jgi:hypothetical protein
MLDLIVMSISFLIVQDQLGEFDLAQLSEKKPGAVG